MILRLALRLICAIAAASLPMRGSAATAGHSAAPARATEPNIVIILLDDVGFGDTSTFGGPAQTPQLSKLAAAGLRYNNFNTTGLCSPTRAALLSGRNHHRMGFGTVGERDLPGYDGVWKQSMASVAQVLRANGYSTAAFGKWHNTPSWEITPTGPFERWPTGLGFEYFYGNMLGMSSQWEPSLWRNTTRVAPPLTPQQGYHFTTDITDEAIAWLHTRTTLVPNEPYLLFFATGAAHTPHHVPEKWIEKYRGRFARGWDIERDAIFARQKQLGVIPADAQPTPRPAALPAWSSLSVEQQTLYARQMEIYAAFIEHTDHEIGRLIAAIQAEPRADDTLILYIAGDNGPEAAIGLEGAENIVATASGHARSRAEQLRHLDELGGPLHTNIYAAGWAWTGSTPFQWMKHVASHLGAVRNPLVLSWPRRIRDRGALRSQFVHVTDVTPTIYDAAGIQPPGTLSGVAQVPLDGVSFADTFDDPSAASRHRIQYFETEGNRAIYQDGWIAAARHTIPWVQRPWAVPAVTPDEPWELYQVATDFSEARDIAGRYPERLRSLQALFDREARDNHVYPLGISVGLARRSKFADQRRFVYRGDFPGVALAARTTADFTQSFNVTASVEMAANASGVIFSAGGRGGGIVLYVRDGHLIYESNFLSVARHVITSTLQLPTGRVLLGFEQTIDPHDSSAASGKLYINGQVAGAGRLAHLGAPDPLDIFDIGRDSAEPVSRAYDPPFAFTGRIESVVIEVR